VKLSLQNGLKVKQVAESLDIHDVILSRWRKKYRECKLQGDGQRRLGVTKKKNPARSVEVAENARLRKENERLRKENDLLTTGKGIWRNATRTNWIRASPP
jgi:transposase